MLPAVDKRERGSMGVDDTTCTYSINEPFETALKHVKEALADAGIKITAMLNLAERFRKALTLGSLPCVILFAFPSKRLVGADRYSAAMLPLHIVVAGRGAQTEVHFLRSVFRGDEPVALPALGGVQAAISSAIGKIGMRKLEG